MVRCDSTGQIHIESRVFKAEDVGWLLMGLNGMPSDNIDANEKSAHAENSEHHQNPESQQKSAENKATQLFLDESGEAELKQHKVFPDAHDRPTPDWNGPVFELSQRYPEQAPATDKDAPWLKYDPKTQMNEYMKAVLDYVLEGNVEANFAGQDNQVRKWYHAPWLTYGASGREFVHGLTMERSNRPGELSYGQTDQTQSWGVGMYNAPGGYTIGQVWKDPMNPNTKNVNFPEGTVSFKILFTTAPESQVPYLKGSPEWEAYVYKDGVAKPTEDTPKEIKKVHLLQMDVAIKDSRSDNGWVLGTYVYSDKAGNSNPWRNLTPVGLAWGNDPDVTRLRAYAGEALKEQVLNKSPLLPPQHLGWGGRLNGPVDNPVSGCVSCHSLAGYPQREVVPPKTVEYDSPQWMSWFKNVKSGEPPAPGSDSLDFSLQLSEGVKHFNEWKNKYPWVENIRNQ